MARSKLDWTQAKFERYLKEGQKARDSSESISEAKLCNS